MATTLWVRGGQTPAPRCRGPVLHAMLEQQSLGIPGWRRFVLTLCLRPYRLPPPWAIEGCLSWSVRPARREALGREDALMTNARVMLPKRRRCSVCGRAEASYDLHLAAVWIDGVLRRGCDQCRARRCWSCQRCGRDQAGTRHKRAGLSLCGECAARSDAAREDAAPEG